MAVVAHEMEWNGKREGQSVRDTRYLTDDSHHVTPICSRQKRLVRAVPIWCVSLAQRLHIPSRDGLAPVIGYIFFFFFLSFFLFFLRLAFSKWLNQINPARELFNAFQSTEFYALFPSFSSLDFLPTSLPLFFSFFLLALLIWLVSYQTSSPDKLECLHLWGRVERKKRGRRRRWRFLTEIPPPTALSSNAGDFSTVRNYDYDYYTSLKVIIYVRLLYV